MARSKKSDTLEMDEPTQDAGMMEVRMRGPAASVKEQMGIAADDEPKGPATVDAKDEFVEALQDPKNIVIVKRTTPRVWNDQRANVEVYRESCPMDLTAIQDEIATNHGGRRFRVAVHDSESGKIIAARVVENDADPMMPESRDDGEAARMFAEAQAPTVAQITEEALDHQARIAAKQVQLMGLQRQLDEFKGAKNGRNGADDREAVAELDRKLLEAQYQAKIDALQAKIEELAKRADAPKANTDSQLLQLLIQQQQKSDERFERMMQQMQSNQLSQIQTQLSEIKNTPKRDGNTLKDNIETLKSIGDMLGWKTGDHDDDDGADDDGEPRPWYEILLEKHLPRVFDLIEDNKKQGKEISKEELVAQINAAADRATADALAQVKAQQARALPAPTNPPATTQANVPTPTVTSAPTPEPAPAPKPMSIEDEMKLRVASVVGILDRELQIRPREWQWTYAAWNALGEDLVEKLATAPDPLAMLSCFEGYVLPDPLAALKLKVAGDERMSRWLKVGHQELRDWTAQLKLDPTFDPAKQDEDEGGDES